MQIGDQVTLSHGGKSHTGTIVAVVRGWLRIEIVVRGSRIQVQRLPLEVTKAPRPAS